MGFPFLYTRLSWPWWPVLSVTLVPQFTSERISNHLFRAVTAFPCCSLQWHYSSICMSMLWYFLMTQFKLLITQICLVAYVRSLSALQPISSAFILRPRHDWLYIYVLATHSYTATLQPWLPSLSVAPGSRTVDSLLCLRYMYITGTIKVLHVHLVDLRPTCGL